MRNLLLSAALIAAPVALFAAGYTVLSPTTSQAGSGASSQVAGASLGDMAPFATIVTDVQADAAKGDMAGAKTRIKDLETAWDDAEPTMRPANKTAWGNVDGSIDDALTAVRAGKPDPATVKTTLAALQASLTDPAQGVVGGSVQIGAGGVAVTDANGRALPCEVMLKDVRTGLGAKGLSADVTAKATDLQSKATERCNADDDKRADDFSAQAIALLQK